MSGSLSGFQMSPAAWSGSQGESVGYDVGDENVTTGSMYQHWTGGDTRPGIGSGYMTTAGQHLSYAKGKGPIPLAHSRQTQGSYLFTAEEGSQVPTVSSMRRDD